MIEQFIRWLSTLLNWEHELPEGTQEALQAPVATVPPVVVESPIIPPKAPHMTNQQKLYQAAADALGKRMILDPSVPDMLGCASSLSHVLMNAGVKGLPKKGISGTAQLHDWMLKSGLFQIVATPQPGDIISSRTGTPGARLPNGHIGVVVKHGICSNKSETGLWSEHWTLPKWIDYYQTYGHIPTVYLRLK